MVMTRAQKAQFDAGFGPIWQKMEDEKEEARREVYKMELEIERKKKEKAELAKPKRGRPRSGVVSLHDCCSIFREPTEYWHKKKVSKQPKKMLSKKPKKVLAKIYTVDTDDPFGVMNMIKAAKFENELLWT